MFMETCGYPSPSGGLRVGSPLSPPVTPTSDVGFPHSPECSPQLFAETHYTQTGYSGDQIASDSVFTSHYDDDANNNNNSLDFLDNGNLVGGFSRMNIAENERKGSPRRIKKTSKSKKDKNGNSDEEGEEKKSRKDSFVYDVRLPNEQYLFFVPDLDLVKSHLMFAVREEVEVLKEKIVDLLDRIHNLECENTILKQYASPEALQQIQQQLQQLPAPTQQQLPPAGQQMPPTTQAQQHSSS